MKDSRDDSFQGFHIYDENFRLDIKNDSPDSTSGMRFVQALIFVWVCYVN